MNNSITFDTISADRLNTLKTLLKSFYMGEYMPPVEVIQEHYDCILYPNEKFYHPGVVASCIVSEHISEDGTHELAANIVYASSGFCSGVEHWSLENVNKWID